MGIRPFTDTLRTIRLGELQDELTTKFNELVKAINATGKTGELVLKLKLKTGSSGQVEVFDDLTLKLPKPTLGSTLFFATPEGNLQREDPRQAVIEGLRRVEEAPSEPLRTVSNS